MLSSNPKIELLSIIGVVIILICSLFMSGMSYAQPNDQLLALVDVDSQKTTITKILRQIGSVEGVQLSYSEQSLLYPDKEITMAAGSLSVQELLEILTKKGGLTYKMVGKNIILKPAQEQTYTVSGYVYDDASGETMIGTNIQIKGTLEGTSTNVYGFYSLTLPAGEYTLVYSSVGYENQEVIVDLRQNQKMDIRIKTISQVLEAIVVTAEQADKNVTANQMGNVSLNAKAIENIPRLMGEIDVIRAIKLLPGVQTTSEASSGFSVRGGGHDQNLILLDEAVVYNPTHLLGFFSTFNNDAIKNVEFYKGNMPARFGGRLSSLLDIRMKEGDNQKLTGNGGVSPIASRLTLQAPIVKNKGSVLISGRRTYADLFSRAFGRSEAAKNTKLYFYDLNLKANYRINDNNSIYLSGYFGEDVLDTDVDDVSAGFSWGNITSTLRWNHVFNQKLFANTSLIFSNYDYNLNFGTNDFSFDWDSDLTDYTAKVDFDYFVNASNTIKFGVSTVLHKFDPGTAKLTAESDIDDVDISEGQALDHAIYLSNDQRISPKLQITYGARFSIFQNIGRGVEYRYDENYNRTDSIAHGKGEIYNTYFQIEPRFTSTFQVNDGTSIKASYARNAQFLHLMSNSVAGSPLDVWVPSSPNLKPQLSDQVSAGYFRNFLDNKLEASIEVYYKWIQRQVDFRDHAQLLLNEEVEGELRIGKAWSYGTEFMLRKPSGKLNGWVSFTWSRSFRKTPEVNQGRTYRSPFDRPINVSVVANYELSERASLSANAVFFHGIPLTAPAGRMYYGNKVIPTYTERNGDRIPAYNRVDVGLNLKNRDKGRKVRGSWNFSIYNLYGRRNPAFIVFRENDDRPNETEAARFAVFRWVPTVTYNFEF